MGHTSMRPIPGTEPATAACALTGNPMRGRGGGGTGRGTFRFAGGCSAHGDTQVRALVCLFKGKGEKVSTKEEAESGQSTSQMNGPWAPASA